MAVKKAEKKEAKKANFKEFEYSGKTFEYTGRVFPSREGAFVTSAISEICSIN